MTASRESPQPPARCRRCGAFDVLADSSLCEECYCAAGTCCAEFGADDLWPLNEGTPAARAPSEVPPGERGIAKEPDDSGS